MCLRVGILFQFSKICLHFQLFVYNFAKKLPPSKHILALPMLLLILGAKAHYFYLFIFFFQLNHPTDQ